MKFTEILEELKKGKKATREKWETTVDACSVYFIVYNQKKGKCEYYLDGRYDDEFVFVWDDITAEDWKIYQENPTQMWKPEDGDKYYYITSCGAVDIDYFYNNNYDDECRIRIGNVFKTKEKALHMVEKIKIINKLRELSNIKFNETDDRHYMIVYNKDDEEIISDFCYSLNPIPFNVFFETREDCENAISTIGEENLKKYYFDIAEVEEDK